MLLRLVITSEKAFKPTAVIQLGQNSTERGFAMGCAPGKQLLQKTVLLDVSIESLTEKQKQLIRETWKTIETRKTMVGVNTFLR